MATKDALRKTVASPVSTTTPAASGTPVAPPTNTGNPLLNFAKGSPTIKAPSASSSNPLLDFAGKSGSGSSPSSTMNAAFGEDANKVPKNYDEARKLQKENPSMFQKIMKQLMKPVGVVATFAEDTGNAISAAMDGNPNTKAFDVLKKMPSNIGGVITGTKENSFFDVWREYGAGIGLSEEATKKLAYVLGGFNEDPNGLAEFVANRFSDKEGGLASTIGFVGDIAADPLNYLSGGLTNAGKTAQKVSSLNKGVNAASDAAALLHHTNKIGEVSAIIKEGSKLSKEIKALGLTDDMLKLAATKAEQVQQGQRAFLKIFTGTRWEKDIIKGRAIYETTAKMKTATGAFIHSTKLGEFMNRVWNTKTTDEAFNATKEHFDNLLEYRKGRVMENAVDIQNDIAKLSKEDSLKVIDVIENTLQGKAKSSGVAAIDDIAKRLTDNFREMHKAESALGLVKSDIQGYFPHIKVKEDLSVAERLKRMLYDPKKYSTALSSSNERDLLKFVSDKGDELIGMPEKLGLKALKDGSFKGANGTIYKAVKHGDELADISKAGVNQINEAFGTTFFEDRPAVAYAQRALGSAKAQTSKEFFESVKSFALPTREVIKESDELIDIAKIADTPVDEFFKNSAREGMKAADAAYPFTNGLEDFMTKGGKVPRVLVEEAGDGTYRLTDGLNRTGIAKYKMGAKQIEARITNKKVLETIGEGVETSIKELKGYKFAPDIAQHLETYQRALKPEDLNVALRAFDKVQNWWKAQALVAPSYHIRNSVGNFWNNFLAGVVDPTAYIEAGKLQKGSLVNFTDDAGRVWNNADLIKAAKQNGVINEGWYAKDIDVALDAAMSSSWNPFSQNFKLFQANKAAGSAIENNARLAHFITKVKQGNSIGDAALSVKKYLFDYADLTPIEKNFFKRVVPFYTWTRKNIPLQFEALVKQPAKFAAIGKTTRAIEATVEKPNEKYLGDYIRENVGIRVGADDKGNTYYFLMGNWLPAAQAIDFISQPTENLIGMISPFFKTPVELWANKSTFFEDTLGQPSQIERYPEENQSWLGFTMRKKTAYVLKNIRILNELDKLNPGSIFGSKNTPSLANRIAPEFGFRLPGGIGTITTSERETGRYTPQTSQGSRVLQSMFGKLVPYNPRFARKFYLWDTDTKVRELERAIKDAKRDGQDEYAKRMMVELKKFKKERR